MKKSNLNDVFIEDVENELKTLEALESTCDNEIVVSDIYEYDEHDCLVEGVDYIRPYINNN